MGVASAADEVEDGDALGRDRRLGQQAERAGQFLGGHAVHLPAVQDDTALPGESSRDSERRSVDFPQAFAPTMTVISPGGTTRSRDSMTARSP